MKKARFLVGCIAALVGASYVGNKVYWKHSARKKELQRCELQRRDAAAKSFLIAFDKEKRDFSGVRRYTDVHKDLRYELFWESFAATDAEPYRTVVFLVDHEKKTVTVEHQQTFYFPPEYVNLRNDVLKKDGVYQEEQFSEPQPVWNSYSHRFEFPGGPRDVMILSGFRFPASQGVTVAKWVYNEHDLIHSFKCKPIFRVPLSKEEFLEKQQGPVTNSLNSVPLNKCLILDTENEKTTTIGPANRKNQDTH